MNSLTFKAESADETTSRLRRKIRWIVTFTMLVACTGVSAISLLPFYFHKLATDQAYIETKLSNDTIFVRNYFRGLKLVAGQISSRSQARKLMIQGLDGRITYDEYSRKLLHILSDAQKSDPRIMSITRKSVADSISPVSVGISVASGPTMIRDTEIVFKNERLIIVIRSKILGKEGVIGYDEVEFDALDLRKYLQLTTSNKIPTSFRLYSNLQETSNNLLFGTSISSQDISDVSHIVKELSIDRYWRFQFATPRSYMTSQINGQITIIGIAICIMILSTLLFTHKLIDSLLMKMKHSDELNRQKSRFLANISHEIRTSLNGIIGASEIINDEKMTDVVKRNMTVISHSSIHLLELIENVLELSKIEAMMVSLESIEFDLKEAVENVRDSYCSRSTSNTIRIEFSEDTPERIVSDRIRLHQVLYNLVENADKYTKNGSILIRTSVLESNRREKTKIQIDVEDTGCGIPVSRHSSIFNPFVQSYDTSTREYGGSGLGLAICKKIVELMGGNIEVVSCVGKGSIFRFSFLADVTSNDFTKSSDSTSSAPSSFIDRSLKVLLVEDNQVNQDITVAIIEKMVEKVDVASNGAEAVERSEEFSYDLIFMDCHMPIMDGLEATRKIRASMTSPPPIIYALTASVFADERQACLGAGMDGFIEKPISKKKLSRVLVDASQAKA